MVEPHLADFVNIDAMAAAAAEERAPAPRRLAGDGGRATPAQIESERVHRDLADRLGVTGGEAA